MLRQGQRPVDRGGLVSADRRTWLMWIVAGLTWLAVIATGTMVHDRRTALIDAAVTVAALAADLLTFLWIRHARRAEFERLTSDVT